MDVDGQVFIISAADDALRWQDNSYRSRRDVNRRPRPAGGALLFCRPPPPPPSQSIYSSSSLFPPRSASTEYAPAPLSRK